MNNKVCKRIRNTLKNLMGADHPQFRAIYKDVKRKYKKLTVKQRTQVNKHGHV